jgi:hypothetical protein
MLGWRKVRRANIPKELRDTFERFGEPVMQEFIAASDAPRAQELLDIYPHPAKVQAAADWLTERGDIRINAERRLEAVQWAVLFWAVVAAVAAILALCH